MYHFSAEDFYDVKVFKYKRIFESHHNSVFQAELVKYERPVIIKFYKNDECPSRSIKECRNLMQLKSIGINVPQVLSCLNGLLVLEYIPGVTAQYLSSILDKGVWIHELAEWFSRLHSITKGNNNLLKGDVNLRNFILSNKRIYGLDFEEMTYGNFMEDISDACLFLLTNNSSFKDIKERKLIVRTFLKEYESISGNSVYDLPSFLNKSRTKMKLRRKLHCHS